MMLAGNYMSASSLIVLFFCRSASCLHFKGASDLMNTAVEVVVEVEVEALIAVQSVLKTCACTTVCCLL